MSSAAASALPVLYSFRRCPYAMRARLALAVSAHAVEHREVALRDKPAALIAASPKATVPVMVLPSGQVIDQSLAIMTWALAQNDPERWLSPERGTLDEAMALISGNDGAFKFSLDRYKYPNRYPQEHGGDEAAFALSHRASCSAWLTTLNERSHGGWLFGPRACLADMAILPFVRQFAHTDRAWFAAQPWPGLIAWLHRFEASALFDRAMQKHATWQPA